jgi:hypothetical protein
VYLNSVSKQNLEISSDLRKNSWESLRLYVPLRASVHTQFVEIKMPESRLHAQAGIAMYEAMMESILGQFYFADTSCYDSGLLGSDPASICASTFLLILDQQTQAGSKQPDISIGFLDMIENQCFFVGETGYSD